MSDQPAGAPKERRWCAACHDWPQEFEDLCLNCAVEKYGSLHVRLSKPRTPPAEALIAERRDLAYDLTRARETTETALAIAERRGAERDTDENGLPQQRVHLDVPGSNQIPRDRESWDSYFLRLAVLAASRSKDRSTQVGCILVGPHHDVRSTGYNGFPRGAPDDDDSWHDRENGKYLRTVHAEGNAITSAARMGTSIEGCVAYITLPPCSNCMGLLIQAGVTKVIALAPPSVDEWEQAGRWTETFTVAQELSEACKVPIIIVQRSELKIRPS